MSTSAIEKACAAVGSQSKLARALAVSDPTVSQWVKGQRPVPVERCVAIERATAGAVMRWDLRPRDWADIWPELAARPDAPPAPGAAEPVSGLGDLSEVA